MKRISGLILYILCLVLTSCGADDEPESLYTGPWEVTFSHLGLGAIASDDNSGFEEWAESHKDNIVFSLPPLDDPDFSFENSLIVWKERVMNTTEESVRGLVNSFCEYNDDRTTSFGASYQKYDPSYTGPWIIIYNEMLYQCHNNDESYHRWFDEHKSEYSCNMAYPNGYPVSFEDYLKCQFGFFQWVETIDNISEADIREKIQEFRNFSTPKNFFGTYDYFDAYYLRYDGK